MLAVVRRALRQAPSTRALSTHKVYSDPNFPLTGDGRVHHLDVKLGEVANRVLSVGDAGRGKRISAFLDGGKAFEHRSSRGFVIYTGLMNKVPVTIAVTGMGYPMMDFVVRELRAVVRGPMAMLRLGTCGGFGPVMPGDISVADQSTAIIRNPDYFNQTPGAALPPSPYIIAQPVSSDPALAAAFKKHLLKNVEPLGFKVHSGVNASGDTFYSAQGRTGTMFRDANEGLIKELQTKFPRLSTMEMETFHLLDLARCSNGTIVASGAAIAMANRVTKSTVDEEDLRKLEAAGGKSALAALAETPLDLSTAGVPEDSVWTKL